MDGFDSRCFVKPEPQSVTKIFGPVKSLYGRAQIVVVEQWGRAPKLGKVVAAKTHQQIGNRLLRGRVPGRLRFSKPVHRLTPDFLSRGGKHQALSWRRNSATKL